MSRTNIFSIPSYDQYNASITFARMLLSFYVLFGHSVFWYDYYFSDVNPLLRTLNLCLYRIFQGSGETNLAVIAFITISGYCIHRQGMRLANWDIKQFMQRRFFRIYPMFLIGTILGVLVYNYLRHDPKIITITFTNKISLSAVLYKLSGFFAFVPYNFADVVYIGNGALMTCAVEVWLYICYPFLGLLAIKHGGKVLWSLIAATTVMGVIGYTLFPELKSWWHNGSLFGFLAYWWIGVYAVSRESRIFSHVKVIICIYVALTFLLMWQSNIFMIVELRKILFSIMIGAGMQWLEAHPVKSFKGQSFFESGYSLYALHTPLICLALYFNFNFYLMAASMLLIAYGSYMGIERPIISLGKSIRWPLPFRQRASEAT